MSGTKKRIAIIGAGPTGLGAAYRLSELGHGDWDIYEKNPYVGGLAASYRDPNGFTWDTGLHVIYSSMPYFLKAVNSIMKKEYYSHLRRNFIYDNGVWIPYPFQNNIKYLAPAKMAECLAGLLNIDTDAGKEIANFEEWIYATFGCGIARHFMIPYNLKVWQHDLKKMSYGWIGERVSLINVEKVIDNIMNDKDDISWGTHNRFRYPAKGGMGGVFCRLSGMLARHPLLGMELLSVDLKKKRMAFKDGSTATYDYLINTSSLDTFFLKVLNPRDRRLSGLARKLKHTKTYIVGIGIEGTKRFDTCWIYFPAKETSFYRVTYSNYSPYNVPGRGTYSITCEVSSRSLGADHGGVVKRVVEDLVATGLISWKDRRRIVSTHILELERSYPVPTIDRDLVLNELQSFLRAHHIYSRGRFGAWKYEIGNMDHSFMQGVEAVDKILFGKRERTLV